MKKDVNWEDFFAHNHRYADIINGIGCKGFQVVQETDLHTDDTKSGSKTRDALRKVAFGANFAIIGIENQDNLDYKLPLRSMAYDLKTYEKQAAAIRRNVRENARELQSGEYLYGFMQTSKLHPSITFVLYSGEEPWNGARSLHEILDFTDIPEPLREMTSDYKINVIDIRRLEDTSVFQTDVKQVFDFIRCSEDKSSLQDLLTKDSSFQDMEEDAINLLAGYTDSVELKKIKMYKKEGGKRNMCKGLRDWAAESREEGRVEGRTVLLTKFLSNGGSKEDAVRMLEVTEEEVETAEKCLAKMG